MFAELGIAVTPELGIAVPTRTFVFVRARAKAVRRAQGNMQWKGRAYAKAVGAKGADGLRIYGSEKLT